MGTVLWEWKAGGKVLHPGDRGWQEESFIASPTQTPEIHQSFPLLGYRPEGKIHPPGISITSPKTDSPSPALAGLPFLAPLEGLVIKGEAWGGEDYWLLRERHCTYLLASLSPRVRCSRRTEPSSNFGRAKGKDRCHLTQGGVSWPRDSFLFPWHPYLNSVSTLNPLPPELLQGPLGT